jgi:hydrogenase 3 maturation protease
MGDIEKFLAAAQKPLIFAGVGNSALGDDGAGPELARLIKNPVFASIDCGFVPENYLEKLAALNAATIVIIDATDLRKSPGSYTLLPAHQIANVSVSTHSLSLKMMAQYLAPNGKPEIFLLAIKPATLEDGRGISIPVKKTIIMLASKINEYHER